jgi:2-succinyl-5-enolpyruvyl-6-hydroxy-3-cyclohexene-1-carboxylate synthase
MGNDRAAGVNIARAARLIAEVCAAGVREFCVCAGSRNSPLLAVLGASDAALFSFVDERSAAFFALGRMKLHGAPVAVVTTSGTAVAELLPACVEAFYSGLPLVMITADRPERYRGTGAPQSIDQVGLFGVHAETALEGWSAGRPLHLNVEFEEPLIDGDPRETQTTPVILSRRDVPTGAEHGGEGPPPSERAALNRRGSFAAMPFARGEMPAAQDDKQGGVLVLVGGLAARHRPRVRTFLQNLNAPTYAEPLSGLREDPALPLITSGERMIGNAAFGRVIRIGNVPTLRFWRDLEDRRDIAVVHYSDLPFPGLTRGDVLPIETLPDLHGEKDEAFFARDREFAGALSRILDLEPYSELAMIRDLSRELAEGTRVYLGNSLPIREWDLAATREPRGFAYEANRGANGIDGQVSTFLGWCAPEQDNVCVVGDLTAIYDLNAPWIVPQLGHWRFRIVVVNNGGGRIFSRVASLRTMDPAVRTRIVENEHDVRFEHWAGMWGIDVTELRPEADASQRVWARYDALWS